jgi:peptidoglycan-associated lipoprotein
MSLARSSTLVLLLAVCGSIVGSGCGPKYPACKSDEDCNKDKPRNEFCVNQTCQQCRGDKDCAAGRFCNKGRCDAVPGYCKDDAACGAGMVCDGNRCKPCKDDGQCGEGGKCRAGKCIRKGQCESDDDCPQDQDCKAGVCVGGAVKAGPPAKECSLAAVYFDFNEFVLSTEATEAIDKNATCIKVVGRAVRLVGRSDPRGTEEYNLALSERRAQQIKDRLMRLGLDGTKLHTLPKGELESTGKDEAGWANDRRVDFEWL